MSRSSTEIALPELTAVQEEEEGGLLSDLMVLMKARLSFLVITTTFVGFCLAAGPHYPWLTSPNFGNHSAWSPLWRLLGVEPTGLLRLFSTILGTTIAAAAAAVLNQVVEADVDRLMERTRYRPIPAGRIRRRTALALGLTLSALGPLILWLTVNGLSAILAAATIAIYVLLYTPLKRRTPLCTLVGAVAGAIPPVVGWVAVQPSFGTGAWVLFGVLFLWQMPHFLAIAWMYRDEYAQAGFVMLRREDHSGCATAMDSLACTLGLTCITTAPFLSGLTQGIYLSAALTLDCAFLFLAVQFLLERDRPSARRLFFGSILYLPAVLALMVFTRA